MNSAIGIDIGGTKISIALGTSSGKIILKREIPTWTGSQTFACLEHLCAEVSRIFSFAKVSKTRVVGIGVCLPGAVNTREGTAPRSPNLPGWKGVPIRKILEKKFRVPVMTANDANAAAVGEAVFGQAKKLEDFVYITVSTGIGAGIYSQGSLLEGVSYVGGEIGHMIVVPRGHLCACGHRGCLEAYASGTAMAKAAASEMRAGVKSRIIRILSKDKALSAKILGKSAKLGDKLALRTYETAAFYLGIGIANILNMLNPQKIILGGGVLKSAPPQFLKAVRKSVKTHAWPEAFRAVKIVESHLKNSVGNLGALALVFNRIK